MDTSHTLLDNGSLNGELDIFLIKNSNSSIAMLKNTRSMFEQRTNEQRLEEGRKITKHINQINKKWKDKANV